MVALSATELAALAALVTGAGEFAALSDHEAADALNAPLPGVVPAEQRVRQDVETTLVKNILRMTGEWGLVVLLARQNPDMTDPAQQQMVQAVAAAETTLDTLTNTNRLATTRDDYWAAMQTMIAGLQQAGVVSQASAEAMLALAWRNKTRAEIEGLPPITATHVGLARGGRI